MSGKEGGAFRVRFERNGYALPTMTSAAIERELSTLVWPWLNAGKAIGDEGTPWSVNLLQPDLIVDFRLIPHWGIEGDELGYVERGAAGGLMISIELPTPRTPIPLQPKEAKPYFEGGTPLAYYRSYLLSSLLPVPSGVPPRSMSGTRASALAALLPSCAPRWAAARSRTRCGAPTSTRTASSEPRRCRPSASWRTTRCSLRHGLG